VLFAFDLHFGAAVLAEEDAVASFDVELTNGAVFEDLAIANGHDLGLDRLLFGRIGDDDAALGLLFFFDSFDDDAVLQGADGHVYLSVFPCVGGSGSRGEQVKAPADLGDEYEVGGWQGWSA
jgi:hypothetical protein